jgi:type III restriction enzyme
MKIELTDYQETAAAKLVSQLRRASERAHEEKYASVLSAPTGSGKTAIITAVMERLLDGDEIGAGDPAATFLWVTDAPELNEQSKKKILTTSEVFTPNRVETIQSDFNQPTFDPGKIYFLNTQKLGVATSYTRHNDGRDYTLWETISRTASERPKNFFLVIDEAHKGIGRGRAEILAATTIVQRLILGGNGIVSTPLLIGISATPARFNILLEAVTDRHRLPITQVNPDDVRESGLLKDDIILWHTHGNGSTDWALLREAAKKLKVYEKSWRLICERENWDTIRPILVVQVLDGTGKKASNTNLATALAEIESVLGKLRPGAIAHCFQDQGAMEFAPGRTVPKVQPSDIQEHESVRVVFFKMALNTGWDCPRAEVMMSFRRAVDHTLIAQLVGRMVRTPRAARIVSDNFLNSVSLYLPNWDEAALSQVVQHLTSSEDAIPAAVERGENLATYAAAPRSKALFAATQLLPTYPSRRTNKSSNVKRLMQLARYLANDEIDPLALEKAQALILDTLETSRRRLRGRMRKLVTAIQKADLVETRIAVGVTAEPDHEETPTSAVHSIRLVEQNILDLFADAGRRLGAGLHVAYLRSRLDGKRPPSATVARAELCVLINDRATQESLERVAGKEIKSWWTRHHSARLRLSLERQADYARVNRMAAEPEPDYLHLPSSITVTAGPKVWKQHLYADANGQFRPSPPLNRWETLALNEELQRKGFKAWLRNPVRKEWSLGVPYEEGGVTSVMYPDFMIFRSEGKSGVICDLIEPHAPNQGDLAPKLRGFCKFANEHGDKFGRLELVIVDGAKGREKLLRINVNDPDVRDKAKLLTDAAQVVQLARELNR